MPTPSAGETRRLAALTVVRDEIAAELGLQPGLVCPKALLKSVAEKGAGRGHRLSPDLTGWRLEVLGEPFSAALAGME